MTDTLILACRTIETELRAAMEETGTEYPVVFIESGLHNTPKKLHKRLAEELSLHQSGQIKRVLMAMGFCGNSVAGLATEDYQLIIPRADDCISLLLGSVTQRQAIASRDSAYFLTEGWMKGERNLWVEYQYSIKKYGEETAKEIADMMYGHYRTLALLDNGIEPVEPLVQSTEIIARTFQMEQKVLSATLDWLKMLLTGPWNEQDFLIIPPYSTVGSELLKIKRS